MELYTLASKIKKNTFICQGLSNIDIDVVDEDFQLSLFAILGYVIVLTYVNGLSNIVI